MQVPEGISTRSATLDSDAGALAGEPSTARGDATPTVLDRRTLVAAGIVAVGYYAGVQVGLAFTPIDEPVSVLWPPNAILFAALLLAPPRVWWVLIAAVFPAHVAAELVLGVPLWMVLCWYVSNVAEALLGAAVMIRYLGGTPRFDRVRDVSVFLIVGVLLAPVITSFLDTALVALVGWRYSEFWLIWRTRLLSNALAALTLVPLIVIWCQRETQSSRHTKVAEYAESVVLLVGLCVTAAVVFHTGSQAQGAVLVYAPLPFLVWAAVRRDASAVSLCVAIVALLAITGMLRGRGPFVGATEGAVAAAQVLLIIAGSTLVLLAASLAELRRARAAALQQEASLNLALSAAQMGTWEWDIEKERVDWHLRRDEPPGENPGWSSATELLGRVHVDDLPMVRRALRDALEKGDVGEIECRFVYEDGSVHWISSRGKTVFDEKGKPQRLIGVYVDTTERRIQDLQARELRDQLARLSRVSILGELSGALAHELNQPLAAIQINAEVARSALMRSPPDLETAGEILSEIISDNKRAGQVIRRLRALFERGSINVQRVDLNECIREVLTLDRSHLIQHHVVADLTLAEGLPPVMIDRVQLQQVLLNLIANANDAVAENERGDRLVKIVTFAGNATVEVEISDTGYGIQNLEVIFDPFFSTKEHGIGLGLAISRTIVAAHGGRLWATNNATRGATLHISLPTATEERLESDQRSRRDDPPPEAEDAA
jgi:signal transduction histidine kinase